MRVRDRADLAGKSYTDVMKALELPSSSMANYWSGKRPWPLDAIVGLADLLDTSADSLLRGDGLPTVSDRRASFHGSEPEENADLVEIDEIDMRYGLGGTYVDMPASAEKRTFSREWLRNVTRVAPESLFWTIGDGDSMEPTIRSGEVVLIDGSNRSPRTGDGIWAVAMGEIGMIKRVHFPGEGRVQLLSDNKVIPPIDVGHDELHVVGRVVAVVRRL